MCFMALEFVVSPTYAVTTCFAERCRQVSDPRQKKAKFLPFCPDVSADIRLAFTPKDHMGDLFELLVDGGGDLSHPGGTSYSSIYCSTTCRRNVDIAAVDSGVSKRRVP